MRIPAVAVCALATMFSYKHAHAYPEAWYGESCEMAYKIIHTSVRKEAKEIATFTPLTRGISIT